MTGNTFIKDGAAANITDPKLAKIFTDAELAKIKANSEAHTAKVSVWALGISIAILSVASVFIISRNPANSKDVMLIVSPMLVSIAGLLVGGPRRRIT